MFFLLSLLRCAHCDDVSCALCVLTAHYVSDVLNQSALSADEMRCAARDFCNAIDAKITNDVCAAIADSGAELCERPAREACAALGFCPSSRMKALVRALERATDSIAELLYNRTAISAHTESLIGGARKRLRAVNGVFARALQPAHDKVRAVLKRAQENEL